MSDKLLPWDQSWDQYGTATQPHVPCPWCGESDEIGSHYDQAWCLNCEWRGSLRHMRRVAAKEEVP